MWAVKHKSGTVLFVTNCERTANNRREMGWIVEEVKMTSREQFEQKIQHEYGDDYLAVNDDGDYINWITSDLWEYWAASREAIGFDIEHPVCWRTYYPDTEDEVFRAHAQSNESCAKRIASEIGGYVIPVYHGKPVHVEVKK